MTIIKDELEKYKEVIGERIIYLPTPRGRQPFDIVDIMPNGDSELDIFLRHVFHRLGRRVVKRCKIENGNGAFILNKYKASLDKPVPHNLNSNITSQISLDWVRKKGLDCLIGDDENSFLNKLGGELDINGFNVNINTRIGADRGFTAMYRKNITGFNGKESYDELLTRIMPVGFDGITIVNDYVDSPNINKYGDIYTDTVKFEDIKWKGSPNNSSAEGFDTLEEAQEELINATLRYFIDTKCDLIKATFDVNIALLQDTVEYKDTAILEQLFLGDDIEIDFEPFDIKLNKRMVYYTYDSLLQRYETVQLGEGEDNYFSDVNDKINKLPSREEVSNGLQEAINQAFKNVNDLISSGGNNSYIKFIPDILNPREIVACDNEDLAKAVYCVRFNKNGVGASSTGFNGVYHGLVTESKFVIDEITCNTFSAALIKTDILSDVTGKTWINMDDGTFNFADKMKFDGTDFTIDLSSENLATNEQVRSVVDINSNSILTKVSNSNKLIAKNTILTGDFTSATGSSTIGNWIKNTISASASTFATDGTNWCNFYTSTLTGELFAYQDVTLEIGKPYDFSCKIAKYSTTAQSYCIRIQEYIDSVWTTKKEFTGVVDVDRANALVLYSKYKPTVNQVRIWIGKTDGNKFDIYATDFQLFYTTDLVKSAEIKILNDKISTKVNSDDFGTIVEQNAYSVKIAWNKISNYVQFENGGLSIYNGAVSTSQKRAVFDENGNHFWRDGYYLGKIGTNQYEGNSAIKGIVFDLESDGGYMTWAVKKYSTDPTYTMMLTYANKTLGNYTAGKLHAGCDIDMHNYYLRNVNFEGGGITGTMNFVQITAMNSNGTAGNWYNNSKLVFQNGILIDGTWG